MQDPALDTDTLAFLRGVAARKQRFLRPDGDPDTLPLNKLLMSGLPPRPAREASAPYQLWRRLVTSSMLLGEGRGPAPIVALRTGYNRLGLKGHLEASRNWSGAVISSPYREKPFSYLLGTWTIPDFDLPPGAGEDDYACSTWIGFDGHRRTSNSLPQLGTVQHVSGAGSPSPNRKTVRAWWQWWHRDDVTGPIYEDFEDLSVEIGHEVAAFMFAIPTVGILMKMANFSTGAATRTVLVPPPRPDLEPRLLDAECVLERPRSVPAPQVNFMTPKFAPTTFRCYAALRGEAHFRTMRGGRLIRMIHRKGDGIETIAIPDPARDRSEVTVRYCMA